MTGNYYLLHAMSPDFHSNRAGLTYILECDGFSLSNMLLVLLDVPRLDVDYTVFGECVKGLEIIDLLCAVPINQGSKRPIQDVPMSVRVIK